MASKDAPIGVDEPVRTSTEEPIGVQLRLLAEQGDVRGLLNKVTVAEMGLIDFQSFGELVSTALEVLGRSDPKAFAELLHTEVVVTVGKLMVRAHFQLEQQIKHGYLQRKQRGTWSTDADLEAIAGGVLALHLHLAKLQQLDANTRRLLEHARKLRMANDKVEARKNRPRRPSRRQRVSEGRPHASPASRISEGLP